MRYKRAIRRDTDTAPSLRMYQHLWELIAKNTSDVPVKVRCPVGNQGRLIRGVRKEKTADNMARKQVDAMSFGKLITKQEGEYVFFSLTYNGDLL